LRRRGNFSRKRPRKWGLCAESGHFYSGATKEMWSVCGFGAFLLGNDLGLRSSTTSLPPIYTYLQFSQVTGTDIDFLNNHNFLICGVGAFLLGSDQGNGVCVRRRGIFTRKRSGCARLNNLSTPYIYIFTIFSSDRNRH
jgi:hypothetical protein